MNDFSSIDKLVEFGLGIAVAQQMIKTVNHSIDNMRVAGVNNRVEGQIAKFYAVVDGQLENTMKLTH